MFDTTVAFEGTSEFTGELEVVTSTVTSESQVEPALPQDLTCSVCVPLADDADVFTETPLTTAVFVLSSSE
jgi:hypothetical protein